MIKTDQTTFGIGTGNCFAACVATLLGLPITEVPNFCCDYSDEEWYMEFVKWLKPRGLAPLTIPMSTGQFAHFKWAAVCAPKIPWIAGGQCSRGPHCVVYVGPQLLHDPNPTREGLTKVEDATYILVEDLVSVMFPD